MSYSADGPAAVSDTRAAPTFPFGFQHVAVFLLLGIIAVALWRLFPLSSKDLWTHLKYGEWIGTQGRLPDKEPFCAPPEAAQELTHTQWLTQIAIYQIYRLGDWIAGGSEMNRLAGGVEMLRLALALLILLRMVFLTVAFRRLTGSLLWAVIALSLSLILTWSNLLELRPQMIGEVFFALLLMMLSGRSPSRVETILAIPFFVLWANCHASFLGGLGLVALCLIARILDRARDGLTMGDLMRRDLRTRRLAIILLLGLVAVGFVNPHGWKLFDRILTVDGHPNGLLLDEWQALRMERAFGWHWFFLASMLVAVGTHLLSPRGFSAGEMLLLFAFAATGCIQQRMLAYWAMVLPWLLAPHWVAMFGCSAVDEVEPRRPSRKAIAIAFGALAGGLIALSPLAAWMASGRPAPLSDALDASTPWALALQLRSEPNPEPSAFPVLHRVLAERYPDGRFRGKIVVDPKLGDFLLWKGLPINVYSQLVFFTAKYWGDQDYVCQCNPGWWEILDLQEVNLAVLGPDGFPELRRRLIEANWRVVHQPGALNDPRDGRFDGWILIRPRPVVE